MTTSLKIDLSGLEDKWSLHCQEKCVECGINFEELDEVPLLLWKNNSLGLALCWKCGQPRIGEMKKK